MVQSRFSVFLCQLIQLKLACFEHVLLHPSDYDSTLQVLEIIAYTFSHEVKSDPPENFQRPDEVDLEAEVGHRGRKRKLKKMKGGQMKDKEGRKRGERRKKLKGKKKRPVDEEPEPEPENVEE